MKQSFASILLLFTTLCWEVSAQSFQPPWWLNAKAPQLSAPILRSTDQAEISLEVFYPGLVDENTLDSNDLWVVSRSGYNDAPKFVSARPVYERDSRAPRLGDADLPAPTPEERLGVLASYRVVAPDSAWSSKDNESYSVLINAIQVGLLKSQDYIPLTLLGSFRVAVGEPEPARPTFSLGLLASYDFNEPIEFNVTYRDERALDPRSVGEGDIYLEQKTSNFPGTVPELWRQVVPVIQSKEVSETGDRIQVKYRVVNTALAVKGQQPSVLFPGNYAIKLAKDAICDMDGMCLGEIEIGTLYVTGELGQPLPPESTILVKRSLRQYFASAQLELPPGVFIADWGSPILDGNVFTAELTLRSWANLSDLVANAATEPNWPYRASQIWGESRFTYPLGWPKPGAYSFLLRYQGKTLAQAQFESKELDLSQTPPPQGGQLWVEEDSKQFLAFLELSESGLSIVDWGVPKLIKDVYRIDLKTQRLQGGEGNPGTHSGAVRVYELGHPNKEGSYQVQVFDEQNLLFQTLFSVKTSGVTPAPPAQASILKIEQQGEEAYANVSFEVSPDQPCQVTEWGTVTRRGNVFFLDAKSISAGPLTPENRTCSHRYRLLPASDPGGEVNSADLGPDGLPVLFADYSVVFRMNGVVLSKVPFTRDFDGVRVRLQVQDIWEPSKDAQEFAVTWTGGPQMNVDAVRAIEITVRSEIVGYSKLATIKKIDAVESFPPQFIVRYAIPPPGDAWDFKDNGRYDISYVRVPNGVDPLLAKARPITMGSFFSRIGPDLPESAEAAKVSIKIAETAKGQVAEVRLATGVSFEITDWGESELNGDTFYVTPESAKPSGVGAIGGGNQVGGGNPNAVTEKEQGHDYALGRLKPGLYVFVFKTSGPAARLRFWVNDPNGGPSPTSASIAPRENWREAAFVRDSKANRDDQADPDGDGANNLLEYAFGTNPLDATSSHRPKVGHIKRDGKNYATITYRQVLSAVDLDYSLEVSPNLGTWLPLGSLSRIIDREGNLDGTETVTAVLSVAMEDAPKEFLRVRVDPRG